MVNNLQTNHNKQIWLEMLSHLRVNHSQLVRSWFDELDIIGIEHGQMSISAKSPAQQRYLQGHCTSVFIEAAQSVTGRLISVIFHIPGQSPGAAATPLSFEEDGQLVLNEDYLFENFVAGPCNRLAHAASLAIADAPGKTYNPLFIHGSVGLGKSHLLQGVCHNVRKKHPELRVLYLSCEMFINHFVEALERGALHNFRYRYRYVDALIIDDVHFLANKDSSQEEFFHTFNTLYQAQKQIVLSSDRCPAEIKALEERLVSRFNWGLVAGIDKPCYETRMAIIRKKAKLRGLEIPEAVVATLAESIDSNTRDLEGAITKLQGLAMLAGGKITLDLVNQIVDQLPVQRREVSIQQILDLVSHRFNVKLTELQSKKRTKSIALPRQICMFLARSLTRHSLAEIGGYFGGRDHTTVLHATRTIGQIIKQDHTIRQAIEELNGQLTNGGRSLINR